MIFMVNEQNPQKRFIQKAVDIIKQGGVIIYPTDTVYAYGCDIRDKRAIERIYRIKKLSRKKPLSFIFPDISGMNAYVRNISNMAFKIMKSCVPGPYTFIFNASKLVPRIVITNQKTIGVRVPDCNIAQEMVSMLGHPIMSASVSDIRGEYITDPSCLEKIYRNEVDLVIDCGIKTTEVSTIIDFTGDEPVIVRQGKGPAPF